MLLQPATNTTAKLKMGLMGSQRPGKTHTMTSVAIGLVKLMRELRLPEGEKPIAFMDTETGSDWVRPRIEAAGIKLVTAKTRAFTDLLSIIDEAETTHRSCSSIAPRISGANSSPLICAPRTAVAPLRRLEFSQGRGGLAAVH